MGSVAAIDCGSNSTRVFIADENGTSLHRDMTITRLSQGVDESGTLRDEAMERSFATLRRYREACDRYGVDRGLAVATSAVRDATNGSDFLAGVQDIMGFEATILTGNEEATYSYDGATADLEVSDIATMIVDIGGGSTELAVMHDGNLLSYSMQLGCVRVSERALGHGIVNEEGAAKTVAMIDEQLDRAFDAVPAFGQLVGSVRLIGLAGTVATLAQLDAGIQEYDRDAVHHRVLTRDAVQRWRHRLGAESPAKRLQEPGMVVGREDVLVAGLYILDSVMERFGVVELLSSENDILDGIVRSLLS